MYLGGNLQNENIPHNLKNIGCMAIKEAKERPYVLKKIDKQILLQVLSCRLFVSLHRDCFCLWNSVKTKALVVEKVASGACYPLDETLTFHSMNVGKITSTLQDRGCSVGYHDLPSEQQ